MSNWLMADGGRRRRVVGSGSHELWRIKSCQLLEFPRRGSTLAVIGQSRSGSQPGSHEPPSDHQSLMEAANNVGYSSLQWPVLRACLTIGGASEPLGLCRHVLLLLLLLAAAAVTVHIQHYTNHGAQIMDS